jgi:4-hydroxy-2-oxoglutarate aldolase
MRSRIRGIFPPIPTVFNAAGDVDSKAIATNVERWMRTGLAGVLALGSNGEAALLDEAESDRVIEAARSAVPSDRLLVAGVGQESTRATIAAARRAANLGADLALVRPPSYYKNQMSVEVLVAHFRHVADASPIPVLLYNLPATGVVLTLPVVAALAGHPNIFGIKETSVDLERLGQFATVGSGFRVLSGSAPVIYPALTSGAVGGILAVANVLPDACVRLFEHAAAGRHDDALALQRAITPLAQLVTSIYGVAGLKVALELVGYAGGMPRSPLSPIGETARQQIAAALAAVN